MKDKTNIQKIISVIYGLVLGVILCILCFKMKTAVVLPIFGFVIASLGYYAAVSYYDKYSFTLGLLVLGGTICTLSIFINIFMPQTIAGYELSPISTQEIILESPYSYKQFEEITEGMTYEEVVSILGIEGTLESERNYPEYNSKIYFWGDFPSGYIDITFIDGFVQDKYQYHLQ